jgi:hypothetical protein
MHHSVFRLGKLFSVPKAPKRVEKGLKCVPNSPKINENLAKCLLEGVCAHPGCCKKFDPSRENRVLQSTKMAETHVFAKTHLQTLLARRHTPGDIMH